MFIFKLVSYLLGYVVILVTGEAPEKFVNMAAGRGIFLWDVFRKSDRAIMMKVRLNAVRPLRHIARRTRCRFRIYRRRGVPFHAAWLRRRKALALGAVLFLAALYLLSSFVWFIEVRGNEQLSAVEVLEAAEEAGLCRGVPKWNIEAGRVEAKIQEALPLVSWTGVYIKGTRVIIEVAERTVPGEEDRRPAHIVATKEGLVKEVLVLDGYPVVKEGDTVEQGQVLISGEIPPPAEETTPSGGEKPPGDVSEAERQPRYVHAKGIVRARVWYEGYGEAGTVETGRRPTGRSASCVSMKF
ncbi:MAG: putative membrane protein, partial [Pelotomaculum thermopropionicum]